MPKILLPLDDTQFSVDRPVILDIVKEVMQITMISSKTPINYYGDEARAAQFNSTLQKNPLEENRWNYDERITIEVQEQYDQNAIINSFVKQPENFYIFKDEKLGIFVKPVYTLNECKIDLKYKAKDKNQAIRWRNDLRTKVATMRDISLHTIQYHYHFPEEYLVLIKQMHLLRENVDGYGEDWDQYWSTHLGSNVKVLSNLVGTQAIWAIHEKQIRVQGYFDFEAAPDESQKADDHDNYETTVTYTFKYQKPIECLIQYPLMIHNQLLDEKYRPSEVDYTIEGRQSVRTISSNAYKMFESDSIAINSVGLEGVAIPHFDDFRASHILPSSVRVFTALVNITADNKRSLFNLADLGDVQLDSEILDFLRNSEYRFLGENYKSIFCLNLYKQTHLVSSPKLIVNSNLDISTDSDLNLRDVYHIRLGLVTDPDYLDIASITRLRGYPSVAEKLIKAIDSAIINLGSHPDINKSKLSNRDTVTLSGQGADSAQNSRYTHSDLGRSSPMMFNQTLFVQAFRQ